MHTATIVHLYRKNTGLDMGKHMNIINRKLMRGNTRAMMRENIETGQHVSQNSTIIR
jgi:hypothetical protein